MSRRLDDPAYVARQYETEHGLAARKAPYDDELGVDVVAIDQSPPNGRARP
jgi:hypothetical protein